MRKHVVRYMVGLAAFFLGIATVALNSEFLNTVVKLGSHAEPIHRVEPYINTDAVSPRFKPTFRGCGNGYVQGYETDDGQRVAEGVTAFFYPKSARREFKKWVREAKQVIERVPKFRDHRGRQGERIVIANKPYEEGYESVSILFFDGGDLIRFIDAPTLDLALEFEQYMTSNDFRSPV